MMTWSGCSSPTRPSGACPASPGRGRPELKDLRLEELLRTDHALLLSAGQPLQFLASECPPRLQTALAARQVRATLLLPLRLHGELTGFLGFDNCKEARLWEEGIVSLLAGAAGALSLALEQRTTDALRERTEATLRSTEAGLHLLIDGFPEPVLVHAENRVLYVNPATVRYLGHEGPETLVRRPVLMLVRGGGPLGHAAPHRQGQRGRGRARAGGEAGAQGWAGGGGGPRHPARHLRWAPRAGDDRSRLHRAEAATGAAHAERPHGDDGHAGGRHRARDEQPALLRDRNLDFVHGDMQPGSADASRVDESRECWATRTRAPSGCASS